MPPAKLPRKQLLTLAATVTLSLMLAALTSLNPTVRASATHNVNIHDFSFDPQCLCIEKGDTINWTNNDPVIHTLWFVFAENESTYLLSDPILPSQSWSHTFTDPERSTLLYHSLENLWISGTIRVYLVVGDIDGDGDVDPHDLYLLARAYGTAPPSNPECDLDGDDDIDPEDFAIFAAKYGQTDP